MTPRQRDIVLVPVPFSDLTSIRRRPVLVLSNEGHDCRTDDVVRDWLPLFAERAVRKKRADLQEQGMPFVGNA